MIFNIQDDILKLHALGLLDRLLMDKTTGKRIMWATDAYSALGSRYSRNQEITSELITGPNAGSIKTRARKEMEQQSTRTRQHGEVSTPLWVCEKMCGYTDEMWNGKAGWQKYVDARVLEITCGEAPFLVSRYNVETGEAIPVSERIGLLDRKLRAVNENAQTEEEWLKWTFRAFWATYGYEFQGDNLLIARVNLLMTFEEYLLDCWKRKPTLSEYGKLITVIVWNIWQMDGLKGSIPYETVEEEFQQFSLFATADQPEENKQMCCRIYNWTGGGSVEYLTLPTRGKRAMKFDFVIGNPPYQESGMTSNKAEPLYPYFYDAAEKVAEKYILISPARFLFNAGLTAKKWNQKMLSDTHIHIVRYFHNSADVFSNTNINGGVVILYRDAKAVFKPIDMFIPDETLRRISDRFKGTAESSLSTIIYGGRSDLKFNNIFLFDYPDTADRILQLLQSKHPEIQKLGPNEEYELKSSSFERTPYAFVNEEPKSPESYYKILGIEKGQRVYKWVLRKYMSPRYPDNNNIEGFKVLLSNADGAAGQIGKPVPARIIGNPIVAGPGTSAFPTFMSIGNFQNEDEARCVKKYIQTKFVRVLLGVLKITQHITPATWAYVPLQNFTPASDIDWKKSIPEIDQQLYRKYGLDETEIQFIETHVKEMT